MLSSPPHPQRPQYQPHKQNGPAWLAPYQQAGKCAYKEQGSRIGSGIGMWSVPVALSALDRGGTLAIAGIHLSEIPPLRYADHLFEERTLCSVTANTRRDGEEFLDIAARIPIRPTTQPYPLMNADRALADLAHDRVNGAAVLRIGASA